MTTTEQALCEICGHPMPEGEETLRYHGLSGPCPTSERSDETPLAAIEDRDVNWVDVTGWGVLEGHAIPVSVARKIAQKINQYHARRGDMAAAPDLLGAAQDADLLLASLDFGPDTITRTELRAAIARAKGAS